MHTIMTIIDTIMTIITDAGKCDVNRELTNGKHLLLGEKIVEINDDNRLIGGNFD